MTGRIQKQVFAIGCSKLKIMGEIGEALPHFPGTAWRKDLDEKPEHMITSRT